MAGQGGVTTESRVKSHSRSSERRAEWAGSTTWPLASSLSRDASHTTGWRDAPRQGAGPFPRLSGEEDDDEEQITRSCSNNKNNNKSQRQTFSIPPSQQPPEAKARQAKTEKCKEKFENYSLTNCTFFQPYEAQSWKTEADL